MNLLEVPIFCGCKSFCDVIFDNDCVVIERVVSNCVQLPHGLNTRVNADQWQLILQGEVTVLINGKIKILAAGDSVALKKGSRCAVESTSGNPPAIRLVVHMKEINDNSKT